MVRIKFTRLFAVWYCAKMPASGKFCDAWAASILGASIHSPFPYALITKQSLTTHTPPSPVGTKTNVRLKLLLVLSPSITNSPCIKIYSLDAIWYESSKNFFSSGFAFKGCLVLGRSLKADMMSADPVNRVFTLLSAEHFDRDRLKERNGLKIWSEEFEV